jgi:hypothetical protein
MRFPDADKLALPCVFEQIVPGRLHPDGRRYLPLILLGLPPQTDLEGTRTLGIVDRHHVVDPALAGRKGVARLVFLLSSVHIQVPPFRQGLEDAAGFGAGGMSTAPVAYGQVVSIPTWEAERTHLPYEALHTELLLDIGIGVIGVRTSATATSLAESLGKPQLEPSDWLRVSRSRIDILGFEASHP